MRTFFHTHTIGAVLIFVLFPLITAAQGIPVNVSAPIQGVITDQGLVPYLKSMLTFLIGIAGVIGVVKLVICGFELVTAPSSENRSHAKHCLLMVVLGLLLALSGYVLLEGINPTLTQPVFDPPIVPSLPAQPTEPGWYTLIATTDNRNTTTRYSARFATKDACEQYKTQNPLPQGGTYGPCFEIKPLTQGNGETCPQGATCRWGATNSAGCSTDPLCAPQRGFTRDTGPDTSCAGGKPSGSVCCVYAPAVCDQCSAIPQPPGGSGQLNTDLGSRLARVYGTQGVSPFTVTGGFPAGIGHCSNDQMVGRSADIAFTSGGYTSAAVQAVITAAASAGLRLVFETKDVALYNALLNAGVSSDNLYLDTKNHITGNHFSVYIQ